MRRRDDFVLALMAAVALHGLAAVAVNRLIAAGPQPPLPTPAGELMLDIAFEEPVEAPVELPPPAVEPPVVWEPPAPPAEPEPDAVAVHEERWLTAPGIVAVPAPPASVETPTSTPPVVAHATPVPAATPGTVEADNLRRAVSDGAAAVEPLAVAGIRPRYPLSARRRGQEGTVTVRAAVDAAGRCVRAEVLRSSGVEALDRAGREAVEKAQFVPARRDGQPVSGECVLNFVFRLED